MQEPEKPRFSSIFHEYREGDVFPLWPHRQDVPLGLFFFNAATSREHGPVSVSLVRCVCVFAVGAVTSSIVVGVRENVSVWGTL